jgi:hypothetical protein
MRRSTSIAGLWREFPIWTEVVPLFRRVLEGVGVRNWRKFTWFILIVQVLFVIWIVSAGGAVSDSCKGLTGNDLELCKAGTAIGAGIGFTLILILWAIVDFILGIIWLITNRGQRDCPVCGKAVKKGRTKCAACGHDFAVAARA